MDHTNLRALEVAGGNLEITYEDETLALQTFTLDPDASPLEDQNLPVRNNSGSAMAEGDLVYVSGWDGTNSINEISLATAPNNNPHLAQFVLRAALADATSGIAYKSHTLTGQDTSLGAVGDPVYLGIDGAYTLTQPNFARQVVGHISVVNAVTGEVEFLLLSDSDSGFIRSNPGSGEFPISGVRRDSAGNLEVEYDDVAIP